MHKVRNPSQEISRGLRKGEFGIQFQRNRLCSLGATEFMQLVEAASCGIVELGITQGDCSKTSHRREQIFFLAAESPFSPRIDEYRSLHVLRTNRRRQQHS